MAPPLLPPRLVLRVAAVGNRRFGTDNGIDEPSGPLEAAARQACTRVLTAIQNAVADIHREEVGAARLAGRTFPRIDHPTRFWWETRLCRLSGKADMWERRRRENQRAPAFSSDRPLVTVLSGLAQGGDTIGTMAAPALDPDPSSDQSLAAFAHIPVTVGEPATPVPPDSLVVGIIPARLEETTTLLARDEARVRAGNARARGLGFRAQSEALRHHADILMAVWDPDTDSKVGGTAESVAFALRERLPVIAVRVLSQVDSGHNNSYIDFLRSPADLRKPVGSLGEWHVDLKGHLRHLLAFPDPPDTPSGVGAAHKGHHYSSYHPRAAYYAFLENTPFPIPWPGQLRQRWKKLRQSWQRRQRNPLRKAGAKPPSEFARYYGHARDRASEISRTFGDAHRGGIVASYGLGAFAVLIALVGYFMYRWHGPGWSILLAAGCEFLALLLLFALWRTSMFQDWHEAYTDARILAEALRSMEYLAPMGVHTPVPKLPPHLADIPDANGDERLLHDPHHLWSVWYFRALIRQAPIQLDRSSTTSPAKRRDLLVNEWIGSPSPNEAADGSQMTFHHNSAQKNADLIRRVELMTVAAFIVVLLAALAHFIDSLSIAWSPVEADWSEALQGVFLFVCVGMPAALAALTGFLSQIEAVRLKQRSESMMKLLADRHRALSNLDLTDSDSVEARWLLPLEAAATAGLMVDETADWALIYKNSDIHAA